MSLEWTRVFTGTLVDADAVGHFVCPFADKRPDAAAMDVATRELARHAVLHTASGQPGTSTSQATARYRSSTSGATTSRRSSPTAGRRRAAG